MTHPGRTGNSLFDHHVDTCRWQRGEVRIEPEIAAARLAAWFHRCCAAVVSRLPFGLDTVVAPTFLGFALINGGTFAVDLLVLTLLHGMVPLPVAITGGYAVAFGLSYVLNRTLNFRSHAAVVPQVAVYVAVVVVNYLAFILGVSSVLAAVGVEYHLARILSGAGEAVFMYSAMRWVIFRR